MNPMHSIQVMIFSSLHPRPDSTVRRRLKESINIEKPFFEGVPVIGCKYRNRRINCATSFNVDKEFDTIICSSLSFMMAQKKASIWFDCSQAVDITVFFRIADSDVFLLFLYKTRSRQPARDQGEVLSKNNPSLLCSACQQDQPICILCPYHDQTSAQPRECFLSLVSLQVFGRLHQS